MVSDQPNRPAHDPMVCGLGERPDGVTFYCVGCEYERLAAIEARERRRQASGREFRTVRIGDPERRLAAG